MGPLVGGEGEATVEVVVEAEAEVAEEGAETMDALVGTHGDAELGGAGAVITGLGDEAFPGDGTARDGENDKAAVAETLAGVAVG